MIVEPEPYAAVQASTAVSSGLSPVTASKMMKESGRAIALHRRIYILESSFFAYLHELEASEPCRL